MRTIFHLVENHRGIPNLHTSRESQPSLKRLFITKARQRQSLQNLFISSVFFCVGVGIFVHSIVAVTSTKHVCAPHPHCAVMSYQWNVNAEYCSCIVFVNRLTRVTTFNDWKNPRDTTADLAALAKSGHLRITQIVNRALPTFPEELRQFHGMEQVILIYSKTLRIPDWAKEWKALKYLHIEGDFTANRLTYMPDDLFAEMHDLAFLHLGSLVSLPRVPSLKSQHKLQYLTLAMLHSVTEIPDLSGLTSLNLLVFADAIQVYKLPSLANLKKLQQFTIVFRNPVCCNGFITGKCDLSDFQCKPRVDKPVVQCTDKRIPREELAMVDKVKVVLCSQNQKTDLKDSRPTVATTDEACGGVMYKQCTTPSGATGIYYTARMMHLVRRCSRIRQNAASSDRTGRGRAVRSACRGLARVQVSVDSILLIYIPPFLHRLPGRVRFYIVPPRRCSTGSDTSSSWAWVLSACVLLGQSSQRPRSRSRP